LDQRLPVNRVPAQLLLQAIAVSAHGTLMVSALAQGLHAARPLRAATAPQPV
jgi:hypothetical protein